MQYHPSVLSQEWGVNDSSYANVRHPPGSRADFEVSIICALPLEYDALSLLIDIFWDESGASLGKAVGDKNTYTHGRIGNHDVVIALLSGIGKVNAASSAAGICSSYPNIKLVLLTGICGSAPKSQSGHEILLGDVIVADDVIQYDFGRQYADQFTTRKIHSKPNRELRGFLATLGTQLGMERLQQRTSYFLRKIQIEAASRNRQLYVYPGVAQDKLYASAYRHRHQSPSNCACSLWQKSSDPVCPAAMASSCDDTLCSDAAVISRDRLELRRMLESQVTDGDIQGPAIFMGRIASGDTVMKSGEYRDKIVLEEKVIAFEMEGAGLWDEIPSIVVKGVCDYADSHKNKKWQDFAAATAASATKAILERYTRADKYSSESNIISGTLDIKIEDRAHRLKLGHGIATSNTQKNFTSASFLPPNILSQSTGHWADSIVLFVMSALPKTLLEYLQCKANSTTLSTQWRSTITEFIEKRAEVSKNLSNTSAYHQFITGVEKCIWYQVPGRTTGFHENPFYHYEEIPLSLLGGLEKDDERRRKLWLANSVSRRDVIDVIDTHPVPKIPVMQGLSIMGQPSAQAMDPPDKILRSDRIYLFHTTPEETESGGDLSQFQSFLWSLITQILLWRPKFRSLLLGWLGMMDTDQFSLQQIPGPDRLRPFLLSLLELNGSPIVITICHAEWMNNDSYVQSLQFLSELYQDRSSRNVSVHVIASAAEIVPIPSFVVASQVLSQDTERNGKFSISMGLRDFAEDLSLKKFLECLVDFKFEGQFLRRDEVGAADEGTNEWIWSHPSFLSWAQRPSGILWIEGKAGSGKSVLAKTISSNLGKTDFLGLQGIPLPPISDWFYSSRHGAITKSHTAFLRSTLGQILEQNRNSFHHYASLYRKKKEDSSEWTIKDYEFILEELAANGLPAICIVDAMDESDDGEGTFELRGRIIALMADLCRNNASKLRFIVLSRYTADISYALHKFCKQEDVLSHIFLERENSCDVTALAENGLHRMKLAMSIYESADDQEDEGIKMDYPLSANAHANNEALIIDRMNEYITENAEGVILWVKLATQTLIARVRSGLYNLEQLETDLKSLPRGIIDFYKLTLRDLETKYSSEDIQRTRTVLMWVVGASSIRPLALNELFEALCIPLQPVSRSMIDPIAHSPFQIHTKSWLGFYRQLRMSCGPFIEVIIPQTHEFGSSFRKNTEISPYFSVQLLHRTVKDFLHNESDSGALAFSQAEAEELVHQSMKTYMECVLPTVSTSYCPVPARKDSDPNVDRTARSMVRYLNRKYLLEFVLTALPEHYVIPHIIIFETSVYPPLMEQRDYSPWNEALSHVSFLYFNYACEEGLTEAMTNLLTIASILLLSWPTLLRYGPLASALKECSMMHSTDQNQASRFFNISSPHLRKEIIEAIDMMRKFSSHEQSLDWDCKGMGSSEVPVVPSIKTLTDVIEKAEISHGKKHCKENKSSKNPY